MSKVEEWRSKITTRARDFLDEIWNHFLTKNEWPFAWEFHKPHRKAMVCDTLRPLFNSIVIAPSESIHNDRYQLTFLGVLLTQNGRIYESLLIRYLEYLRRRYQMPETGSLINSADVQAALELNEEEVTILGRLIIFGGVFSQTAGYSSDWSSKDWQAGILRAVEDFPPEGSLVDDLERIILPRDTVTTPVQFNPTELAQGRNFTAMNKPRIFISHSNRDSELAEALVNLLRAALPLGPDEIRCTSVDGHRLPTGVATDSFLRGEVLDSQVLLALLTEHSLHSTYVIFELGARWGSGRILFPILAKTITPKELPAPLNSLNARLCTTRPEVHQLLSDLERALAIQSHSPASYDRFLEPLIRAASSQSVVQKASESLRVRQPKAPIFLTAREICTEIQNAPPLQQEKIAEKFLDAQVDWEVLYSAGCPSKQNEAKVDLILTPWVYEGFDTAIYCSVRLKDHPELAELSKRSPMRVRGQIVSADGWSVSIEVTQLSILSEQEKFGTRVHMITPSIVSTIGSDIAGRAGKMAIAEAVKTQVRLNKVADVRIDERGVIVPEISEGSKAFKLLVLCASKELIENYGKNSRDKVASLESQIYYLEN